MVSRNFLKTFSSRANVLAVFLFLLFSLIVVRLFFLQVVSGKTTRNIAQDKHSIYKKLYPVRGQIKITDKYSQEAYLAAFNLQKPLLYAVPQEILDIKFTAKKLAEEFKLDETETVTKLTLPGRKYVILKKQLTEEEQKKITDLNLAGLHFDSEENRVYGLKNSLSHVLGFVGYKGESRQGLYGLEKYFEKELAGSPGSLLQEKDTQGAWIFGSTREMVPPQDGADLMLTIDKSIQFKAENVLKAAVQKHGADSGCVIVVNPKTGAVLAMAGFPDFDPNEYNKVEDPKIFLNEATQEAYEPGSVFKPMTLAAAINEGKITPETTYQDYGKVEVDGYTIKNSDGKANGIQTMTQVLEKSLNTGAIFAKEQIGNQTFLKYLKAFGFGKATDIELPEQIGNLDNLKGNINVNFHTASFGQGIMITPIQLVQAYTALANGGKMMKPYILHGKNYPNGKIENTQPEIVGQVLDERTAAMVSAMLVNVVENGHGKQAGVPGYYIAGKTGTAQVARKDQKGYEENNNIGTFIGYGPVENPVFLMLVRIDNPRSVKFAESTAAPAFGEIAKFILDYYNIPPAKK